MSILITQHLQASHVPAEPTCGCLARKFAVIILCPSQLLHSPDSRNRCAAHWTASRGDRAGIHVPTTSNIYACHCSNLQPPTARRATRYVSSASSGCPWAHCAIGGPRHARDGGEITAMHLEESRNPAPLCKPHQHRHREGFTTFHNTTDIEPIRPQLAGHFVPPPARRPVSVRQAATLTKVGSGPCSGLILLVPPRQP